MTNQLKFLIALLLLANISLPAQVYQHNIDTKVGEYLQSNIVFKNDIIEATKKPRPYEMQEWLYRFYQRRNFQPAWVGKNGLKPMADSLVVLMQEEEKLYATLGDTFGGLIGRNKKALEKTGKYDVEVLGQLEVHLTRAFIYLADINLKGYILPSDLSKYEWYLPVREADLAAILEFSVLQDNVRTGLKSLLPKRKDYWQLVGFLAQYEGIQRDGGWQVLPDSLTEIEVGMESKYVPDLKKRLKITEIKAQTLAEEGILYDEPLASIVSEFQKRHGLEIDGRVGEKTLEALNIPVEQRIAQLKINIERYKWLPEERGKRHIWVNIPEYMLYVYKDDQVLRENVVVVGSKGHKTPFFSSRLRNLVINPYWNVPISIARNEILPKLKDNSEYLDKQRFDVINLNESDVVGDKKAIDWTDSDALRSNFRFRQKPGPGNSLGRIKFNLLQNEWGIYLHDTPSKRYFERSYRAWSHGCVRVKDPVDLAATIIQDDFNYNKEQIQDRINSGQNQRYDIKEELPVHLVYMTAWVDTSGEIQFRDDVYGKDKMHKEAIEKL